MAPPGRGQNSLERTLLKLEKLGVYLLPELRNGGIGQALMNSAIRKAKELDQSKMYVYTVAFLDHLAPGAALYLRSGGRVEAEFLELYKQQ